MQHAEGDGLRACLQCRVTMVDAARCPRCKHPTIDPSTPTGRVALDAAERRARVGRRALFGALALLAAAVAAGALGHLGLAEALGIAGVLAGLLAVVLGGRFRPPRPFSPLSERGDPAIGAPPSPPGEEL